VTDDQEATSVEASSDDQPYTFNWHELDNFGDSDEEFLRWMLVSLVTRTTEEVEAGAHRRDLLDRLIVVSDNFTSVSLSIRANGIELNVPHFVRVLRGSMSHWVRKEAARQLGEVTDFGDLQEQVDRFRNAMIRKARRVASELGVELDEDGDW
jgi:hypothetical protein